jgi:hypothetical protein
MDIYDKRQYLVNYTKEKGYQLNYYTGNNLIGNHTNQTRKTIWINQEANLYNLYTTAHEIGHAIINNKITLIHRSKVYIIFNEFFAWIIGFYISIKFKILSREFFKIFCKCLKTYIRKG